MSNTAAARRELRIELRRRRADLDEADQAAASMAVMARLARVPVLRKATVVAGYRAARGELDIDAALILLGERGADVTVPRVAGEHLEFVRWSHEHASTIGSYGISEPEGDDTIALASHDVILAPLVAFDAMGNRLGQGGGFYDRALIRRDAERPVVIGIAHTFQQVDCIPTEPWDIPIDAVITEDEIIEFQSGTLDPAI